MNAAVEYVRTQADPARAAAAVQVANDELARSRTIPRSLALVVREITAGLIAGELDRWLDIEPYLALLVHRAVLEAEDAVADPDRQAGRDRLRIALDRLATALSLIAEADLVSELRPAKQVARWLADTLDVPQRDIAELLGVDLRRFQRWISDANSAAPEGEDARRVRLVARIANQLRHTLSGAGVIEWFGWERRDLGGAAPAELLGDASRTRDLLLAAGSMRSTSLA